MRPRDREANNPASVLSRTMSDEPSTLNDASLGVAETHPGHQGEAELLPGTR
jgi:hypothetical protein